MHKERTLTRIAQTGVVAVIRAESSEQAIRITEACLDGGVDAIEVTFTVPRAHQVIGDLARRYSDEQILLGAGTVLDPETARIAILEGANYVVSPSFHAETVRLCNRYRIACMPGCMTIHEILTAMEAGADVIKVFPGELTGPGFIRSVRGPLPQAVLMPTGGVTVENTPEWIRSGAFAVGAGGALTAGASEGDWPRITQTARRFVQAVRDTRATAKIPG